LILCFFVTRRPRKKYIDFFHPDSYNLAYERCSFCWRRCIMPRKLENAHDLLMKNGKEFLLKNQDGHLGRFDVRRLTAQCGMATGTFYHYFESKDALVLQILKSDWNGILREVEKTTEKDGPLRQKVETIYRLLSTFELNYRRSAMSLLTQKESSIAVKEREEAKLYSLVQSFLRSEIEKGEIELSADPATAAYLLVQLLFAAARNPEISFSELWACMNFRDASPEKGGRRAGNPRS
jgi:AcrR family transcriptional regulator